MCVCVCVCVCVNNLQSLKIKVVIDKSCRGGFFPNTVYNIDVSHSGDIILMPV